MSFQVDNCCDCQKTPPPPQTGTAAVKAQFLWPGWPGFGAIPFNDPSGVLYRTVTWTAAVWTDGTTNPDGSVTGPLQGPMVNCSVTQDALNGTPLGDGLTGQLVNPPPGNVHVTYPGAIINSPTLMTGTDPFGRAVSAQLSDPVSMAEVKSIVSGLLATVVVAGLPDGAYKFVTFNSGKYSAQNFGPVPGPVPFALPDGTLVWVWAPIFGGGGGNLTTPSSPFVHTPAAKVITDINPYSDFLFGRGFSSYIQAATWTMIKSRISPIAVPTCCQDDYSRFSPAQQTPICRLVAPDGLGNLILNPTDIAADPTLFNPEVVTSAEIGTNLVPGGNPCCQ